MFNSVKTINPPNSAGVYLFRNSRRRIIYIGKAKNLKKRIASYFQKKDSRLKTDVLLKNIRKINWIKTNSEIEALILEAKLIKKHQPIFNVKLRDDKNYFYVTITNEQFPRIFLTHQVEKTKNYKLKTINYYIGPFTDGSAIKSVLFWLRKIFPYCTCEKPHNGYCLNFHIKRCLGFCCNKNLNRRITKKQINEYKRNINELKLILTGKKNTILKQLKNRMKKESDKRNFEKAAESRDKIFSLERVFEHRINFENPQEQQKTIDKISNFPACAETSASRQFLRPRGARSRLWRTISNKIERIEAYDISNIQGTSATGSMITLTRAHKNTDKRGKFIPDKGYYRRFRIKTIKGINDTAMIKEILSRRLKHKEWSLPDLILIDGGRSQLNAAIKIITKQQTTNNKQRKANNKKPSTDCRVISLAKRNEMVYTQNYKNPIPINAFPEPLKSAILTARDEAHRFAIKYHRKLREKDFLG